MFKKTLGAAALAVAVLMVWAGTALADEVRVNVVEVEGVKTQTITQGDSTIVQYQLHATNDDANPGNECNASAGNNAVVTISSPAGVGISTNPISFLGCTSGLQNINVTFTGNTPGTYNLTVTSVTGGSPSVYSTAGANWTLIVEEDTAANTPPTLNLPADITEEATSPSGATVNYSVSATDAEDDPDPTPSCAPASGSVFPLTTTTVNCSVTDGGGLTTLGSFDVTVEDTIAPSINCGSADTSWHADNVSIACTASDAGSGLLNPADASFSLVTSVTAGTETSNASTDSRQVCDATTPTPNCATADPVGGNMIDKKGPTVACETPAPSFLLNQSPADVSATVTDGGSGPEASPVTTAADTSSIGANTASLTGKDNVGNETSTSCGYGVEYAFDGFSQPVDNHIRNGAKAGQGIPLKFQVTDADGLGITGLTAPPVGVMIQNMNCGSTEVSTDPVEQYTAGASGLQDLGGGYYQFNWKTPKTFAGKCKTMYINLGDGNGTHGAEFTFK